MKHVKFVPPPLNEALWRRAERNIIHRERSRLIRKRWIIPAYACPPQMMVKNKDGTWVPEIRIVG